MRKRPTSTAELLAKLAQDPAFQARATKRDDELSGNLAAQRRAEAPLVSALSEVGIQVESAWDLVNSSSPYPAAVPVLLEHLQRAYPDRVREGIARSLAVRESREYWLQLLSLFRGEPNDTSTSGSVKFAIGLALGAAATRDVLDDVLELLRNKRHGSARLAFIRTLMRFRDPRRDSLLAELASDSDLHLEVAAAMKRVAKRRRPAG